MVKVHVTPAAQHQHKQRFVLLKPHKLLCARAQRKDVYLEGQKCSLCVEHARHPSSGVRCAKRRRAHDLIVVKRVLGK